MSEVVIKNRDLEIRLDKKVLVNADQTPDGMVFNFQGGSHYYLIAMNMPIETKERIKQATNLLFEGANLVIDVNNYKNPVYADLTKNSD